MILGGFSSSLGSLDAQLGAMSAAVVEIISLDTVLLLGGSLGTVTLWGGSLDAVILIGED